MGGSRLRVPAVARRILPVLLLAAVLLLPSTSWSHGSSASTSSLTGTIKIFTGGIDVSVTNNGPDSTNWIWIRMVPSVHHTGATMDGGGCGPGGDANTVRCGIAAPGFEVGSTHVVRIMTDAPYPPNGGAQLFTSQVFSGPLVPAGNATGPAPTTPTTPTPAAKCKCKSLTVKIPPSSISIENSTTENNVGQIRLDVSFGLHWVLGCSGGAGSGCHGTLQPKTLDPWDLDSAVKIECSAPCGKTRSGNHDVELLKGQATRTRLANKTIHIVVRRTCQGQALPPVRLSLAFDRVGRLALSKSKLG